MKTTVEMIEVMKAFSEGQEIEVFNYSYPDSGWKPTKNPSWSWNSFDYRIKKKLVLHYWAVLRKNNGSYITTNPKPHAEFQRTLLGYDQTATVVETYQKELEVD